MKKFIIFISFFFVTAVSVQAATLAVIPGRVSVDINQPFSLNISLDTQGADANALQGEINFPAGQFTLSRINDGASPISFWIQAPQETASGVVSFSGIIPGGFQGVANSVLSLWFLPTASGPATVSLGNVELLSNDSKATPISVSVVPAQIQVSTEVAVSPSGTPTSTIAPNPFVPVVSQDPNVYGGKYFLVFSTTDKGSGIDHYDVAEVPAGSASSSITSWQAATSPYLLQDQTLSSDIYVRAVDHDDNATIAEVPASHRGFSFAGLGLLAWIIILLILAMIVWYILSIC